MAAMQHSSINTGIPTSGFQVRQLSTLAFKNLNRHIPYTTLAGRGPHAGIYASLKVGQRLCELLNLPFDPVMEWKTVQN